MRAHRLLSSKGVDGAKVVTSQPTDSTRYLARAEPLNLLPTLLQQFTPSQALMIQAGRKQVELS